MNGESKEPLVLIPLSEYQLLKKNADSERWKTEASSMLNGMAKQLRELQFKGNLPTKDIADIIDNYVTRMNTP